MSDARWRRVWEVFHAVAEAPAAGREAELARLAAGDAELEREVRSLLASSTGAGDLLEHPERLAIDDRAFETGRRLGAYRIVRHLATGGMGAVYLGERADGEFEQQVAIKVVRPLVSGDEVERRFRQERQILAGLEHPAIARLLDGGTAGETPYFVLELVEGEPIDRWCDERDLDVRARLELFLHVCDAVAYAHRNLVVHRDLKPANVLVTAGGEPKLLDFGIAKLLSREGDDTTRTPLMTPSYASPEQIRGEPVTTASDVYSLGVVLYELLAGRTPYRATGDTPLELAREIVEASPSPPSVAARREGGSGERRGRRLQGDLDAIVLRALAAEPERRFPTVEALAGDLRRHLDGLPVLARPDSRLYRAGKLLRRHRAASAATAAAALLLIGFTVVSGVQARRLRAALDTAEAERARADVERRKAERQTELLVGLFEAADPVVPGVRELSAREILDRGAERVRAELAAEPAVQAALSASIGAVYLNLGDYQRARSILEESLALVAPGAGDAAAARTLRLLGETLRHQADYAAARERLERAITIHRAAGSEPGEELAAALDELGVVHLYAGDYESAEPPLRESLSIRRALHGDRHAAVGKSLNDLAILLGWTNRFEEAEALYRESLAIGVATAGERHPDVATRKMNLGGLLTRMGRSEEAERLMREALETRRTIFGERHPEVAVALGNWSNALSDLQRYEEAVAALRAALEIDRQWLGEDHPEFAARLHNLAFSVGRLGRLEESIALYERALAIRERALGAAHPQTAITAFNLAANVRRTGDLARAEPALARSAALFESSGGADHANVAVALAAHAEVLIDLGRAADALPELERALAIQLAQLPEGHWRTAVTRTGLGRCLVALGRAAEARAPLELAVAALDGQTGRAAEHLPAAREALAAAVASGGG